MKHSPLSEKKHKPTVSQGKGLYETYSTCRNLRFLLDIFVALGATPQSYGNLTDNPPSTSQALRLQLRKDDMKVSKAKTIVRAFGYKLKIELADSEGEQPPLPYILVLPKSLEEKRNSQLDRKAEQYPNLSFIWRYMLKHKISKRGLAAKVGLSPGAVFTWFQTDDIMLSHVYAIAKAYGMDVVFTVSES